MAATGSDDSRRRSEWENSSAAFETKRNSEFHDPCQEAAQKSYRCLQRNSYDKTMCQDYFDAYKDCKKRWINERKEGRRKGTPTES